MESKECECSIDGFDLFDIETTMMPETTADDDDNDSSDDGVVVPTAPWSTVASSVDADAVPSADVNALESKSNGVGVSIAMMLTGLVWLQMV